MTIASKSVRRSYYYYYYPYYYYYYKEKERKVNFRTRFFLMLANEFLAFEHSPLFFVDIIIHCSLLRTCRVRVEEKEEFLVYTVLWTLTCHPYLESATALSDTVPFQMSLYILSDACVIRVMITSYAAQTSISIPLSAAGPL